MSSPDVIIIGAGVLGLCAAAELGARGHAVTVVDAAGPNASLAAAGMLAPALEALAEQASPERAALLLRARDRWPAFASRQGLSIIRDGAEWRSPDPDADMRRLSLLGMACRRTDNGLYTPEDWRIEVGSALQGLSRAVGVTVLAGRAARVSADQRRWRVEATDGRTWFAPTLIVATGAAAALSGIPGEVAALIDGIVPWRGQLTPISGASPQRTLRAPGRYVVPIPGGMLSGATMERGRRDLEPDPVVAERQVAEAEALSGLRGRPGAPRVGIRGGVEDGLPLAGPSGAPGLHLALAPLRNGWLLGPLVGVAVADGVEGARPVPDAALLDPLRLAGLVRGRHEAQADHDA